MQCPSSPIHSTPCPAIARVEPFASTLGAACTIARATGCSLEASAIAAHASTSSRVCPEAAMTPRTVGWPTVRVPVLSNRSAVTSAVRSMEAPSRNRMPRRAERPAATRTAIGVARPRAHGQAITVTATALASAVATSWLTIHVASAVALATTRTTTVSFPATRSASACIGAR